MLDFDLAELYQTETKYLKRSVKQNLERFPDDFMFTLTEVEWESLRCNFSTSKQRGGLRYMPYAFTQPGVAMLSGVLNSKKAVSMNISIMRAFTAFRQALLNHSDIATQLDELRERLGEHDVQLAAIYDAIENLLGKEAEKMQREPIGFRRIAQ